jgi:threonyl-tRNA synthetase
MTPLEEIRHSCSHVLATAILRIFPDAKLDIGPPTDTGFYYDIDLDHKLTPRTSRIEAEMKKVADENQPFQRKEVSREEAVEIIKRARPGALQARPPRRHPRGRKDLVLPERRVHRPLRRHARPLHEAEGVQAALDRRRVSPRRREEQAAPAHLRHRLPLEGRTRAVPHAARAGQAARPPQARQGPEAFPHRRGCRPGPDPLDAERLGHPPGTAELHQRGTAQAGLLQVFTPHIGKLELYKTSGHFPYYKDSQFTRHRERPSRAALGEGCSCAEVFRALEAVSRKLRRADQRRTGKETITPIACLPDDSCSTASC